MKKFSSSIFTLLFIAASSFLFSSCQKNSQVPIVTTGGFLNTKAFATNQAIALAATGTDTVYAVNICHPGLQADSVAFLSLPDTIGKYLTANYAGYTFKKAYKLLSRSKALEGYIVAITFNGNPVGLAFDANGIFVRVLEQREGRDMNGQGWHEGGRFGDRDGHHPDTIALSTLPTAITTYFTVNYPKDTLEHALVNRDSSYEVLSKDTGIFITGFTKAGVFIKRIQLYPHVISQATLTQTQLPMAVSTYLSATYPAYVFDTAWVIKLNGAIKNYVVIIEANSTKYLVGFDASGNFVKSRVIR